MHVYAYKGTPNVRQAAEGPISWEYTTQFPGRGELALVTFLHCVISFR